MNAGLNRTGIALLTNKSGGSVARGDLVIIDTANASAFTTTTTAGFVNGQIGIVMEPNGIANNGIGSVAFGIWVPDMNLNASASIGNFIKHHSVAKQGTPHAAPMVVGDFAIALESGTTPAGLLFGSIFQGGFTPSHFVLPILTPDSQTNFDNLAAADTGFGLTRYSDGTQNDEMVWNINLPAGTYDLFLVHTKANNRGKYHFLFDSSDEGNIDGYDASGTGVIAYSTLTGLTITGGDAVVVEMKMSDKNASSSNYYGVPYGLTLVRTGA